MSSDRSEHWLAEWQGRLGLGAYRIELERISPQAVCDERCRVGNSLVGVVADHVERAATIFHTRRLTRADIVHELLHVRYPDWSEGDVIAETDRLLGATTAVNPGRSPGLALAPTPP